MIWLDVISEYLSGPTRLRVRGRSMLPTLRPGDEVVVHPVAAEVLAPGDWVVVRNAQGAFLHRYLGRRCGRILTKGDGHLGLDPAWPAEAVVGRVVEAQRDGRCFYRRAAGQLWRERCLAAGHYLFGGVWGLLRRVKAAFLALFVVLMAVSLVWAAVGLTDFDAEPDTDIIIIYWETASETNNIGFYLWRSLTASGGYTNISGFIPSDDDGAGAYYEYEDVDVTPGIIYHYELEDLPGDGSDGERHGPISAIIPLDESPTPTAPAEATFTATPTLNPRVRFWADNTSLTAGECTTLRWQTNDILAVHFNGAGVSGNGQQPVCSCVTESHTLRVTYRDNTTEDFVITLNVTGQCGDAPGTPTATFTPQPTSAAPPTATLIPTATPAPALPQLTATATASAASPGTAQAVTPTVTPPAPQPATSTAEPDSLPLTALDASSEISVDRATATQSLLPTRGTVEGESPGIPVEKMLSAWLLIVGGIAGAGFVGAGILMWKRQQ